MQARHFAKAVIAATVVATMTQAASLSGKVVNSDRTSSGKSGVTVTLSGTGLTTTTDADGAWSLDASTSIGSFRQKAVTQVSHLFFEKGRLRLQLFGQDILGRKIATPETGHGTPHRGSSSGMASRSAAAPPDTLVYSYGGKVFLRDTITNLDASGIVRNYDTSWNAEVTYGYLAYAGQTYKTVRILDQTWMAENLNYKNGSGADSGWWYKDSPDSGAKYGRLYTWAAAMNFVDSCAHASCTSAAQPNYQGICPNGWHVPSNIEWSRLETAGGGASVAGQRLKLARITGIEVDGTDEYGFRVLLASYRDKDGTFDLMGADAHFWSSSESSSDTAWYCYFSNDRAMRRNNFRPKTMGYSLRCVKDDP